MISQFRIFISLGFIVSIISVGFAQPFEFFEFQASRFARAMSLGNAYTGVAEGLETIYYNDAGLGNVDYYAVAASLGDGYAWFVDASSYDLAIAAPFSASVGTFGLSYNRIDWKNPDDSDYGAYRLNLHFGRHFTPELSLGTSVSYYHYNITRQAITTGDPVGKDRAGIFDLNLSAFFRFPFHLLRSERDELSFGISAQNILNTRVTSDILGNKSTKFQQYRTGLSYTFILFGVQKETGPLIMRMAFDAVFLGGDYELNLWQSNYGMEAKIFNYFRIGFGRESERVIQNGYDYSPQHPVNRYGFGVQVPLDKLFKVDKRIIFHFDYCRSDWQQIDEANTIISPDGKKVNRHALSLKFTYHLQSKKSSVEK